MDNSKSFLTLRGFEAHYVDRRPHTIDLSSHKGCDRACTMCHLTLFGLTDMTEATPTDFFHQMELALDGVEPDGLLKINMMAMGDITLHSMHHYIEPILYNKALSMGWEEAQIRISTPGFGNVKLSSKRYPYVKYYWSLLTLDPNIRGKYLPKAKNPDFFLRELKTKQQDNFTVHFPVINGVNSSERQLIAIKDFLPPNTRINLLPFKNKVADIIEPPKLALDILGEKHQVKVIQVTGLEVGASCGIFRETIPRKSTNDT